MLSRSMTPRDPPRARRVSSRRLVRPRAALTGQTPAAPRAMSPIPVAARERPFALPSRAVARAARPTRPSPATTDTARSQFSTFGCSLMWLPLSRPAPIGRSAVRRAGPRLGHLPVHLGEHARRCDRRDGGAQLVLPAGHDVAVAPDHRVEADARDVRGIILL